jgi:hypothetical protein
LENPPNKAQEQVYQTHNNRFIGTPCNIWGIAATMYALLMRGRIVPQEVFTLHFREPAGRPPIITMGYDLLNAQVAPFSGFLKQTIFTCLAWDPADRPRARQLLESCQFALNAMATAPHQPPPSGFYFFDESLDSLSVEERARQGGYFSGVRHVGDTARGPGPRIDHLNFGPDVGPEDRNDWKPVWAELPPSPRPPAAAAGPARIPSNDDGGVLLRGGLGQPPAQGNRGAPSRIGAPGWRQKVSDGAFPWTAKAN